MTRGWSCYGWGASRWDLTCLNLFDGQSVFELHRNATANRDGPQDYQMGQGSAKASSNRLATKITYPEWGSRVLHLDIRGPLTSYMGPRI